MAKCDKQSRKFENYRHDYAEKGDTSNSSSGTTQSTKQTSGVDAVNDADKNR